MSLITYTPTRTLHYSWTLRIKTWRMTFRNSFLQEVAEGKLHLKKRRLMSSTIRDLGNTIKDAKNFMLSK
jgi:hypothetical protein